MRLLERFKDAVFGKLDRWVDNVFSNDQFFVPIASATHRAVLTPKAQDAIRGALKRAVSEKAVSRSEHLVDMARGLTEEAYRIEALEAAKAEVSA